MSETFIMEVDFQRLRDNDVDEGLMKELGDIHEAVIAPLAEEDNATSKSALLEMRERFIEYVKSGKASGDLIMLMAHVSLMCYIEQMEKKAMVSKMLKAIEGMFEE